MAAVGNGNNRWVWAQTHEAALATAWLNVNKDFIVNGNDYHPFWELVKESFETIIGIVNYASKDHISFK